MLSCTLFIGFEKALYKGKSNLLKESPCRVNVNKTHFLKNVCFRKVKMYNNFFFFKFEQ